VRGLPVTNEENVFNSRCLSALALYVKPQHGYCHHYAWLSCYCTFSIKHAPAIKILSNRDCQREASSLVIELWGRTCIMSAHCIVHITNIPHIGTSVSSMSRLGTVDGNLWANIVVFLMHTIVHVPRPWFTLQTFASPSDQVSGSILHPVFISRSILTTPYIYRAPPL
jgi:hypothetical protein